MPASPETILSRIYVEEGEMEPSWRALRSWQMLVEANPLSSVYTQCNILLLLVGPSSARRKLQLFLKVACKRD